MPKVIEAHTYYTLNEVVDMMHVSRQTVYLWIRNGKLKSKKIGRSWWVSEEVLDDFVKNGRRRERKPYKPRTPKRKERKPNEKKAALVRRITEEDVAKDGETVDVAISALLADLAKTGAASSGMTLNRYVEEAIKLRLYADRNKIPEKDAEE